MAFTDTWLSSDICSEKVLNTGGIRVWNDGALVRGGGVFIAVNKRFAPYELSIELSVEE